MAPIVPVAPVGHKPKLLDQVRDVIRRKYYSIRTEQAYVEWIKRFNKPGLGVKSPLD